MATAAVILVAYAIGSLSFAVIVSRALGLPDPRSYGSGNPGTTNVLRTGRKLAALLTLALVLIGALIVWRHKGNIRNLAAGVERKIGDKENQASSPRDPIADKS